MTFEEIVGTFGFALVTFLLVPQPAEPLSKLETALLFLALYLFGVVAVFSVEEITKKIRRRT